MFGMKSLFILASNLETPLSNYPTFRMLALRTLWNQPLVIKLEHTLIVDSKNLNCIYSRYTIPGIVVNGMSQGGPSEAS